MGGFNSYSFGSSNQDAPRTATHITDHVDILVTKNIITQYGSKI